MHQVKKKKKNVNQCSDSKKGKEKKRMRMDSRSLMARLKQCASSPIQNNAHFSSSGSQWLVGPIYNVCNAAVLAGKCEPKQQALRQLVVNKNALANLNSNYQGFEKQPMVVDYSWVKETLLNIRDKAVAELVLAYKNTKEKYGTSNFMVKF